SGPRRQDTILGDRPAQTRFERLSKQSNDPPLSRVNTLGSGVDRMKLNELMEIFKKLEKKKKSRTPQLKRRLFKVRIESSVEKSLEDAKTQGRYGHDITNVELVTTASALITNVGVSVSTAEPSTPLTTTTTLIEDEDLTIAQTLMKMRSEKSKEKSKEKGVASETTTRLTRGVIMQEPKKPVKMKGKDQISFDEEVARRLEAQMQAELEEEERVARQREEEANLLSWD
ncbi:hypothetical protein Tco_1487551, partial [Tanacetum coccineum]